MNKRTGVLSEYPSLTGFPLIPYYSCQSPLVILLITLCCPSIVRMAAAASMRAEQEGQEVVLTGSPAPERGCNQHLYFLVGGSTSAAEICVMFLLKDVGFFVLFFLEVFLAVCSRVIC